MYLLEDSKTVGGYVPVRKTCKEQLVESGEGQQDQANETVDRNGAQCLLTFNRLKRCLPAGP